MNIDDLNGKAKRAAFGENAEHARAKVVGSGVSTTLVVSLDVLLAPELLNSPPSPWTENRAMIIKLFQGTFDRRHTCPGRGQPQCCGAGEGRTCFPNWRAREDQEWYAQEISKYISLIDSRLAEVTPTTAALAVDEAFELGGLLTEALIKFRWDRRTKSGEKSAAGAREGGNKRRNAIRRHLGPEGTVNAIDALLHQGETLGSAYQTVGKQQGVKAQTIRKEYCTAKKQR